MKFAIRKCALLQWIGKLSSRGSHWKNPIDHYGNCIDSNLGKLPRNYHIRIQIVFVYLWHVYWYEINCWNVNFLFWIMRVFKCQWIDVSNIFLTWRKLRNYPESIIEWLISIQRHFVSRLSDNYLISWPRIRSAFLLFKFLSHQIDNTLFIHTGQLQDYKITIDYHYIITLIKIRLLLN